MSNAMIEITADALAQSVAQALETMAFISPFPPDDPASAAPTGPGLLTRVSFVPVAGVIGGAAGSLELICDARLGVVLASNLLGIAPADPEARERGADALRELANVACGAVLRTCAPTAGGMVEMAVPAQEAVDADAWRSLVSQAATGGSNSLTLLDADGCLLVARFTFNRIAQAA